MSTKTSVIIPSLNEERSIVKAVESAQAAGADEVIVVDGHSHDHTAALADDSGAIVLSTSRGRGVQQNAGAAAASGEVLLFLHADALLGPNCVRQARQAIRNGRNHGAFRQRIGARGIGYRLLEAGNGWRARWLGLPYGDQAIFIERESFLTAGGFPEVPIMEDWMLMRQLRKIQWPTLLPGPVYVSARRWQQNGIVRQTLTNWRLSCAAALGTDPRRLAKHYPVHESVHEFGPLLMGDQARDSSESRNSSELSRSVAKT